MHVISHLTALEILDSRGRPTVQATCTLASGHAGTASVPSGASTGKAEALELRDGDPSRYRGLGCRRAVAHVEGEIAAALRDRRLADQAALDRALCALDGSPNKARLGANALLAVSLAFARACAAAQGLPLHRHLGTLVGVNATRLPRPTINLWSGGKHAGGQVAIQDVLLVPRAPTIDGCLAQAYAVYRAAAEIVETKYQQRALRADEGGLAPPFASAEAMLADAVEAILAAGLDPGRDVALAVDVASSHFFTPGSDRAGGRYQFDGASLTSQAMIERLDTWTRRFPIVSVEDGLAEDDWAHWPALAARLKGRTLVLGDDLLCTNPERILRAVTGHAADALLLKVNQIGTLSEAARAFRLARQAGWSVTVSARSGETEDAWLADLALGWGGDQIKIGSITQSERLAKYNRLLALERAGRFPVNPWPA
jgi:enolase